MGGLFEIYLPACRKGEAFSQSGRHNRCIWHAPARWSFRRRSSEQRILITVLSIKRAILEVNLLNAAQQVGIS